jgi:hypothetical protein
MKVSLYTAYGALNSPPIFDALARGIISNGDDVVYNERDADVAVIWSILFAGRMEPNKDVYADFKARGKPVLVVEVGQLRRGITWRLGFDAVNAKGRFPKPPHENTNRWDKFGIELKPWRESDMFDYIVIATQRQDSMQWQGLPPTEEWVCQWIDVIKRHTKRPIVLRPHPRDYMTDFYYVSHKHPDTLISTPKSINDKDRMDFPSLLEKTHLVINWSSGPAVESIINGVPVIVSEDSFAHSISTDSITAIENPSKPDRKHWCEKMAYTEWYEEEIAEGEPWRLLKEYL